MTIAAAFLLLLVFGLLAFDWNAQKRKNRRSLWLQAAAFVGGAFFIVFPEHANSLAHAVGINRGVDFLIYPIVIWLVRESLLSRRARLEDAERIAELTRSLAIATATKIDAQSWGSRPHSPGASAS